MPNSEKSCYLKASSKLMQFICWEPQFPYGWLKRSLVTSSIWTLLRYLPLLTFIMKVQAERATARCHTLKRRKKFSFHRANARESNASYMFLILLFDQPQRARTCLLRFCILLSLFCASFFQRNFGTLCRSFFAVVSMMSECQRWICPPFSCRLPWTFISPTCIY